MKLSFLLIPAILVFSFLSVTSFVNEKAPVKKHRPVKKLTSKEFKEMFQDAQELLDNNYYADALSLFDNLWASDTANCNVNFYIGVCYMNLRKQQTKAIDYFEKAILKTNIDYSDNYKETAAPVFAYLYLGEAYHLAGKYKDALSYYTKFKTFLTKKNKDADFTKEVNRAVEMTNNAIKLTAAPGRAKVEVFKITNSCFCDYTPVLSSDGKKLYFTSKRKGTMGGQLDNIGEYYDDIYFTQLKNDKWSKPRKIGSKINSVENDVLNCISADGNELYFSRQGDGNSDIYVSKASKKGKWSPPTKLDKIINTKYNETCAFISSDGSLLLFASNRPGGYGGYDLYISEKLENGNWGKPKNMGPQINTAYDEQWPVLMPDGTLYFSSKGHETMGGYDIFKTTMSADSTWKEPVNMGYPLNTPFDDINFNPTCTSGKKGFYTSARAGGFGDADIFQFSFE